LAGETMSLLSDLKVGQKAFGKDISSIINLILLTVVYFIGVGLTSIFARLAGKDFLDKGKKDSYWAELNLTKKEDRSYYRQF
jgi:hypothetical protein